MQSNHLEPVEDLALELAFETERLRDLCEYEESAISSLGQVVASRLKQRIADLRAANTINDLPIKPPTKIKSDDICNYAIQLCDGHFMVICPNHISNPLDRDGNINWSEVSRVKIMEIHRDDEQG